MKIEHWQCQAHHPERQLDFSNLLGACLGGHGRPQREQHCDTRKGNNGLCFSVCDPDHPIERQIRFLGDGTIKSDDEAFDDAINAVLNLNLPRLVGNRKAVLAAFQQRLQERPPCRSGAPAAQMGRAASPANCPSSRRLSYTGCEKTSEGRRMKRTSEAAYETAIEAVLLGQGYEPVDDKGFDRERAIFPEEVLAFIQGTHAAVWQKLEALHGEQAGERVLESLCKWLNTHGTLTTLRHGFKCFGRTLRVAFFRPAHGLNPELEARYQANRLGLTRQLHFSPRSQQSLDVVLSVNGIPVATLELKIHLADKRWQMPSTSIATTAIRASRF